jgi:hypothetical protein
MRKTTELMEKKLKKNKWKDVPCPWIGRLNSVKM